MSTLKIELASSLIGFGVFLIGISFVLLFYTFQPVIGAEVFYTVTSLQNKNPVITPVNENFGLVIPKLGANAPVIINVDPNNESDYQQALTKGVAHAKGTALPGKHGTTFLFAHSAEDFYIANRYNAVFYLLYKLKPNDSIFVFFDRNKYTYKVKELKYVDEDEVQYLTQTPKEDRLVLMTCWPPGTTLQRLLVIAEPVSE